MTDSPPDPETQIMDSDEQVRPLFPITLYQWAALQELPPFNFECGFCGYEVASEKGYSVKCTGTRGADSYISRLYVCPRCVHPTLKAPDQPPFPSPPFGNPVSQVPDNLNDLYEEARRCTSANAYTAAVMLCRKLLMNIAVTEGADEGKSFAEYVEFLDTKGFIPSKGKDWVDHIRLQGNEANHEIRAKRASDAKELVTFIHMLLKVNYEFPAMLDSSAPPPAT